GIGAGQMSRVDASFLAVHKARAAGLETKGAVLGSDAYFPFRDGVDHAAQAGVKAIIQPGGSVRDAEAIAAADEHGIAMILTGRRWFRHYPGVKLSGYGFYDRQERQGARCRGTDIRQRTQSAGRA